MISIVLPAYQEAENLRKILPELNQAFSDAAISCEILVIDTIKPLDDTRQVCTDHHAVYINREHGDSYGDAVRTGIRKAQGDYILFMDSDGSHLPEDAVRLCQSMEGQPCDMVIGSRYCTGGYTDNSFVLKLMSKCLNITYRLIFALPVKDASNSFRVYRAGAIKSIQLECNNFDIVEEMLIKMNLLLDPFSVREIPVSFQKRMAGESKRDLVKFIFSYFHTICRLLAIRKKASLLK